MWSNNINLPGVWTEIYHLIYDSVACLQESVDRAGDRSWSWGGGAAGELDQVAAAPAAAHGAEARGAAQHATGHR